jgi:predicted lactoylglutathione lyase
MAEKIKESGAPQWKENKSEGDSFYFLDPDGHKLEIHVGDLKQRLESLKSKPYEGLQWL